MKDGILFDGRWVRPGMTGVGSTAFNLLAAFAKLGTNVGLILNPGPIPLELAAGFRIFQTKVDLTSHPQTEFFEQAVIPYLCYRHGFKSFVSFEGRVPIFHFGIRTFSYIHDLSVLNQRRSHSLKYSAFLVFSLFITRFFAYRIVTVSQTVADEISVKLKVPPERILVIHNADSGLERFPEKTVPQIPSPYFLSVGMNNPRKNLSNLLAGFAHFRKSHPEHFLILTGNREWIEATSSEQPRGNVINLGFISEGELRFLYRNAAGLVYPSKDEGFGLPLIDAYRHGCPVFCSDIPVFREVMGGHARYFDPSSPQSLAEQLSAGPQSGEAAIGLAPGYSWASAAYLLLASTSGKNPGIGGA